MNPDPVAVHHIRPVLTFSALQRDVIRTVAFLAMAGTTSPPPFRLTCHC